MKIKGIKLKSFLGILLILLTVGFILPIENLVESRMDFLLIILVFVGMGIIGGNILGGFENNRRKRDGDL